MVLTACSMTMAVFGAVMVVKKIHKRQVWICRQVFGIMHKQRGHFQELPKPRLHEQNGTNDSNDQ